MTDIEVAVSSPSAEAAADSPTPDPSTSQPPPAKQAKLDSATDDVGSLRSEAQRRKERLIEMRKAALNKGLPPSTMADVASAGGELPKPIFRNYKPISEDLREGQLPEGAIIDLDVHVSEQLEAAKAQAVVDEVNLFNLAPRKPDWDLKRGVEKKVKKLERRTQRAISEIIRERLKAGDDGEAESAVAGPMRA